MTGLITERDFAEAEAAFPGIERFYAALKEKPATFLDLVRLFLERGGTARLPPLRRQSEPRAQHRGYEGLAVASLSDSARMPEMADPRFSEDRMAELRCCDGVGRAIHVWEPARPRGVMLAIHGGLAHAGDWVTPALHFKERGWVTAGFDLHGHDGKVQAHIPHFGVFLDDVALFLAWVKTHYPGLPIVFLTHSMGALIAAHFALSRIPQGDPAVKGYVMSSPYFGNAVKVPKLLLMLSGPVAAVLPRMSVPSEDIVAFLTHDQAITERHRRDEKDHIRAARASARLGNELLKAQSYVAANIARWNQPLFLVTAGEDRLADLAVTNRLVGQIDPKHVERHHYPGNYHENFNELNRAEIFGNIELWLAKKLGLG